MGDKIIPIDDEEEGKAKNSIEKNDQTEAKIDEEMLQNIKERKPFLRTKKHKELMKEFDDLTREIAPHSQKLAEKLLIELIDASKQELSEYLKSHPQSLFNNYFDEDLTLRDTVELGSGVIEKLLEEGKSNNNLLCLFYRVQNKFSRSSFSFIKNDGKTLMKFSKSSFDVTQIVNSEKYTLEIALWNAFDKKIEKAMENYREKEKDYDKLLISDWATKFYKDVAGDNKLSVDKLVEIEGFIGVMDKIPHGTTPTIDDMEMYSKLNSLRTINGRDKSDGGYLEKTEKTDEFFDLQGKLKVTTLEGTKGGRQGLNYLYLVAIKTLDGKFGKREGRNWRDYPEDSVGKVVGVEKIDDSTYEVKFDRGGPQHISVFKSSEKSTA